jgi:small subunit ribosomal protein S17
MEQNTSSKSTKKHLTGVVVSDKMDKTVVVQVVRNYRHAMYHKFVRSSKKYKAHNAGNKAKVGDTVLIIESRPLSAQKRWVVKEIIGRAA